MTIDQGDHCVDNVVDDDDNEDKCELMSGNEDVCHVEPPAYKN